LLIARAASLVGDEVRPFALSFAALSVDSSRSGVGLVLGAGLAPQFVVLQLGGWWSDRHPPLRTLIVADLVRGVVLLATAALWLHGAGTILLLVAAQIVCAIAEAFFVPSAGRLVVTLSPSEQ
jgi:MFS family permease